MCFSHQLKIYLRARFTLIVLVTHEEERAIRLLREVAQELQARLYLWDLVEGLKEEENKEASPMDPLTLLERIDKEKKQKGLWVLIDFHEVWGNERVRRKLRSVAQRLAYESQTSLVILTPNAQVPVELREESVLLEMPLPEKEELAAELNRLLEGLKQKVSISEGLQARLVQSALGLTSLQARRAYAKAIVELGGRLDERALQIISQEKKQVIRDSKALEFYEVTETLEAVGGLEELKKWLKLREHAFSEEARQYGLPEPKGIALIGIPGTGKSLTAKAIASLWRMPLLRLDVGAVFGSFVGESEERIRQALRLAEAIAPCILWIDEIEKAFATNDLDGGTSRRVFGTFLTWMQEKKKPVFVVATANDVSALPPELLRKGRFDEIFFLDLPTESEREEIFRVQLTRYKQIPQEFEVGWLAKASEGYVGAEIEQAIVEALYRGFSEGKRRITTNDILDSLRQIVPISRAQQERIELLRTWLKEGRARSASLPEAFERKEQKIQLDFGS
ncbi:MAG: AAA family ATPase [Bacteroidia bacterium]|nr:AAA family ATPase [Bacteroidia bacterium]